jgi:hypothetical protein
MSWLEHPTGIDLSGLVNLNFDYTSIGSATSPIYTLPVSPTVEPFAYIPAQKIGMQVIGMIPNTRLTIFFDGMNVTKLCSPGVPVEDLESRSTDTEFQEAGKIGDPVITNSNGVAAAIFHIPDNFFQVGVKKIAMFNYTSESDSYESKYSNNSCHAFSSFTSTSFADQDLTVLSTSPVTEGCSANTLSGRTGGSVDFSTQPLCQSFFIGSDMADGQDGIYVNSVDLYFSAKSNTQPVSIEFRTMSNDSPTETVVPYSVVSKSSSLVTLATTATSSDYTRFTFEKPVYLKAGYYYALAITPGGQNPDYSVWTATVGKTTTAGTVNSNWGQGKLYKSTTAGSTWTPVQNQFLKFRINRNNYTASGSAKIVNGDYEFISFINPSNIGFIVGEYLYQQPTAHVSICSVNTTSNTLTLNTTAYGGLTAINSQPLNDFAVNDHIVVCGSFPTADQSGWGRFNYNLFGNSVTLKVVSVDPGGQNLTFGYANGASITGAPWANGACHIYKVQPGEVTYSTTSRTITGSGTRFDVNQNTNEKDQTDKRPLVIHAANTTVERYEVLWPSVVANSTSIVSKNNPLNNIPVGAKAIPIFAPVGRIVDIDYTRNLVVVDKSTANASTGAASSANVYATPSFFAPGRTIVGTKSGATAIVSGIHSVIINSVQPIMQTTAPQGTTINFFANATASNYTSVDYPNFSANKTNYFTDKQIIVASRSAELLQLSGNKSFIITANLISNSAILSPTIDLSTGASLLSKTNIISSAASGEDTNFGTAKSKYVSKAITLNDGNDAEDINVYLTAYKPVGTNILVFVKILNSTDNEIFEDKNWSILRQVTNPALYSDSLNQNDYKEYQYTFPTNPIAVPLKELVTVNNSANIVATNADTAWNYIFTNGQLVTLYSDVYGTNFEVNKISTVNSNTSITLVNPVGLANTSSAIISTMPFPYSAFKNVNNGNIVRYYNTNGSAFDSFNKFAIKIVFLAQDNKLVPKVADIRAIALSV